MSHLWCARLDDGTFSDFQLSFNFEFYQFQSTFWLDHKPKDLWVENLLVDPNLHRLSWRDRCERIFNAFMQQFYSILLSIAQRIRTEKEHEQDKIVLRPIIKFVERKIETKTNPDILSLKDPFLSFHSNESACKFLNFSVA